jgi:hypothetical protein
MGLLEELIILVKETIDEVSERNRERERARPQPSASPTGQVEIDELRARMLQQRRAAAEAARAAQQAAEAPPPAPRHHHHHERRPAQAPVKAAAQPQSAERLAKLLRQPQTVRELFVLKELLDKPLSLRRGRR